MKHINIILILILLLVCASPSYGQIVQQPQNKTICSQSIDSFIIKADSGYQFQWQDSTSSGWNNLSNGTTFQGVTDSTLTVYANQSLDSSFYRCIVDSASIIYDTSNTVLLRVLPPISKATISNHQVICYDTKADTIEITQVASGADNNFTYQWQVSTNGSNWSNLSGSNLQYNSPGDLTNTRYYRVMATSTFGCGSIASDSVKVYVHPKIDAGRIGSFHNLCFGTKSDTLKFLPSNQPNGGGDSFSYQWQVAFDTISFSNLSGAANNYYQSDTLQTTRYYRVVVTSLHGCSEDTSNNIKVNVYADFDEGSIIGNDTICYDTRPDSLKVFTSPSGGGSTYSYQWLGSTDLLNWTKESSQTNTTYKPQKLQSDKYYKLEVTSTKGCGVDTTSAIKVKVWLDILEADIANHQIICYDTKADTIEIIKVANGADNNFTYQWQVSTNGSNWSNLSGSNLQYYSPGNLTNTRYYRVMATSTFGCGSIASDSVKVYVHPKIDAGKIGSFHNLCFGTKSDTLKFLPSNQPNGGGDSFSYQWQVAFDTSYFSNIGGATYGYYQSDTLQKTRYYRIIVTSLHGCSKDTSNNVKVNVYADFDEGNIIGNDTICFNTRPNILTVNSFPSGGGSFYNYQWLSSANQVNWSPVSGQTNTTYKPPKLQSDKYYRLEVSTSKGCGLDTTNTINVKVWPIKQKAIIIDNQIICYNTKADTVKITQKAIGANGNFTYQWQESLNGNNWNNLSGYTLQYCVPGVLDSTRFYRVVATSTFGCGSISSDSVKVYVHPEINAGKIGSFHNLCFGSKSDTLKFLQSPNGGGDSFSYQWQIAFDTSYFSNIGGATYDFYQSDTLQKTRYFRTIVNSLYGCNKDTTNNLMVNVYADFDQGNIIGNDTICFDTRPDILTVNSFPSGGGSSYNYQWLSSANQVNWSPVSGQTNTTYKPPKLQSDKYYRLEVSTSKGCGLDTTNTIKVKVWPIKQKAIIIDNQIICYNTKADTLKITQQAIGADGNFSYQWQESLNVTSWNNLSGYTLQYCVPGVLDSTRFYRVVATSTFGCGSISSDSVKVYVHPEINAGKIGSFHNLCFGNKSDTLKFLQSSSGGGDSFSYQWQIAFDTSYFSNIGGATYDFYQSDTLQKTRYFRTIVNSLHGCSKDTTNNLMVNVYADFDQGNIIGNDTICYDTRPDSLMIKILPSGGGGTYSFQWIGSADQLNWTKESGQTNMSYKPQKLQSDKYYKLEVTSTKGCGIDTTNLVKIKVNPLPIDVVISGDFEVCFNQDDVIYEIDTVVKGYSYDWNCKKGNIFYGKGKNISMIHWNGTFGYDSLFIKQTIVETGCEKIIGELVEISPNASPNKTNILRKPNSNILVCDDTAQNIAYQWGYDIKAIGEAKYIQNATLRYVQLPHTFDTSLYAYWVLTSLSYPDIMSCETKSYLFPVISSGIEDQPILINNIFIYPNPSSGILNINCRISTLEYIEILDLNGNVIHFEDDPVGDVINLKETISNGFYIIVLWSKEAIHTEKILLNR